MQGLDLKIFDLRTIPLHAYAKKGPNISIHMQLMLTYEVPTNETASDAATRAMYLDLLP